MPSSKFAQGVLAAFLVAGCGGSGGGATGDPGATGTGLSALGQADGCGPYQFLVTPEQLGKNEFVLGIDGDKSHAYFANLSGLFRVPIEGGTVTQIGPRTSERWIYRDQFLFFSKGPDGAVLATMPLAGGSKSILMDFKGTMLADALFDYQGGDVMIARRVTEGDPATPMDDTFMMYTFDLLNKTFAPLTEGTGKPRYALGGRNLLYSLQDRTMYRVALDNGAAVPLLPGMRGHTLGADENFAYFLGGATGQSIGKDRIQRVATAGDQAEVVTDSYLEPSLYVWRTSPDGHVFLTAPTPGVREIFHLPLTGGNPVRVGCVKQPFRLRRAVAVGNYVVADVGSDERGGIARFRIP